MATRRLRADERRNRASIPGQRAVTRSISLTPHESDALSTLARQAGITVSGLIARYVRLAAETAGIPGWRAHPPAPDSRPRPD